MNHSRRKVIKQIGSGLLSVPALTLVNACTTTSKKETKPVSDIDTESINGRQPFYDISLAQWSLNRSFFGKSRELGWEEFGNILKSDPSQLLQGILNPIDFPLIAKRDYGLDAVEFVNTFYFDKAENKDYMSTLKAKCDDNGVKALLIMCDALGNLGSTSDMDRTKTVENHYKWVDAAKFLGCHSIRVNAAGEGTADEVADAAVQGLGMLSEYGEENNINVIVENHGGYSSNGKWLSGVISQVNNKYCGTLPDFGNFCIERDDDDECVEKYDRYLGMEELIPFAKGVSAKSHEFDENGNEVNTDFMKMLKIVKESGFSGYVDIEYEGDKYPEPEGIMLTKALLEKVRKELS